MLLLGCLSLNINRPILFWKHWYEFGKTVCIFWCLQVKEDLICQFYSYGIHLVTIKSQYLTFLQSTVLIKKK